MTNLPSREKFNEQYPDDWPVGWRDVLNAFASGELKTEAEWRDRIDLEAALIQARQDGADEPWKVALIIDAAHS